jgi:hypothetical protein
MEILQVILKDAKAFGFETYRFFEKAGGMNCTIEDPSIGEKFTRRMLIEGKIGSDEIEDTKVGFGFKEMIASLEKNVEKEKQTLKIYFHKVAILITNGSNFFYVLNTVVDSK